MSILATPTYALYGEFLQNSIQDFLHYETIKERSQKHNWSIKPHKHADLSQLFYFKTDDVRIYLGSERDFVTDCATFLYVPAPIVHGFRFNHGVEGGVISINSGYVRTILEDLSLPLGWTDDVLVLGESDISTAGIENAFNRIEIEFSSLMEFRNISLENIFKDLLLQVTRTIVSQSSPVSVMGASRNEERVRLFCHLLEEHYKTDVGVRFYADNLNVSPVHLTRICRAVLDRSPNEMIMSRKMVEAKRLLKFTRLSVQEVAFSLHFKNIGYFSRFFKRHTGVSPSTYRNDTR